jgi:hypothetical protein
VAEVVVRENVDPRRVMEQPATSPYAVKVTVYFCWATRATGLMDVMVAAVYAPRVSTYSLFGSDPMTVNAPFTVPAVLETYTKVGA